MCSCNCCITKSCSGTYTALEHLSNHGCQMAVARFFDRMCFALRASGLWLRYATLQNLPSGYLGRGRAGNARRGARAGFCRNRRGCEERVRSPGRAGDPREERRDGGDLSAFRSEQDFGPPLSFAACQRGSVAALHKVRVWESYPSGPTD